MPPKLMHVTNGGSPATPCGRRRSAARFSRGRTCSTPDRCPPSRGASCSACGRVSSPTRAGASRRAILGSLERRDAQPAARSATASRSSSGSSMTSMTSSSSSTCSPSHTVRRPRRSSSWWVRTREALLPRTRRAHRRRARDPVARAAPGQCGDARGRDTGVGRVSHPSLRGSRSSLAATSPSCRSCLRLCCACSRSYPLPATVSQAPSAALWRRSPPGRTRLGRPFLRRRTPPGAVSRRHVVLQRRGRPRSGTRTGCSKPPTASAPAPPLGDAQRFVGVPTTSRRQGS